MMWLKRFRMLGLKQLKMEYTYDIYKEGTSKQKIRYKGICQRVIDNLGKSLLH